MNKVKEDGKINYELVIKMQETLFGKEQWYKELQERIARDRIVKEFYKKNNK